MFLALIQSCMAYELTFIKQLLQPRQCAEVFHMYIFCFFIYTQFMCEYIYIYAKNIYFLVVVIIFSLYPKAYGVKHSNTYLIFFFLGLHLKHIEFPGLGVRSELQLQAYTTARKTPDPSHICELCCSLWQCWIINPLSEASI